MHESVRTKIQAQKTRWTWQRVFEESAQFIPVTVSHDVMQAFIAHSSDTPTDETQCHKAG